MSMTITQIEYVLALARIRHFARAALELHITQPTLSMQLKKLEESLGVVLFDRSKSPLIATQEGERFISQAQKVMHEIRLLFDSARTSIELEGTLRLGIIPSLSPYLLPLFLKAFHDQYPKIELTIEEIQTMAMIEKLKEDRLDAGLLATPLHDSSIVERVLFYEEYISYLSMNHPLLIHKQLGPQDLQNSNIWLLEDGHCMRHQVLTFCSRREMAGNIRFTGGSLETIKNLVSVGQDMTILPKLASNNLPTRQLRTFKGKRPMREISLIAARPFLKERYLDALEISILENLPPEMESPKKGTMRVLSPLAPDEV